MIKKENCENPNNHVFNQNKISKKRIKKLVNKKQNQRSGHWNQQQKIKYVIFLELHKDKFEIKQQRRTEKIFKIMSNIIHTRTPDQCRSHHQKMQKHYNELQMIIDYHKNSIIPEIYEQQYQRFLNTYCKNQSKFEQSDEVFQNQKIPIIIIPEKIQKIQGRIQQGFQSFGNSLVQNHLQFNMLQSIYQIYMMCLHQDTNINN